MTKSIIRGILVDQVQVAHTKAQLSALLERVEAGEEVVIDRRGQAIARRIAEPRRTQLDWPNTSVACDPATCFFRPSFWRRSKTGS